MSHYDKDYETLVREHKMFLTLIARIQEDYLPTDVSFMPKTIVCCEQLPMESNAVTVDDWHDMVAHLGRAAETRAQKIAQYRHIQAQTSYEQAEETQQVITQKERKPQQPAGGGDRGGAGKKAHANRR